MMVGPHFNNVPVEQPVFFFELTEFFNHHEQLALGRAIIVKYVCITDFYSRLAMVAQHLQTPTNLPPLMELKQLKHHPTPPTQKHTKHTGK